MPLDVLLGQRHALDAIKALRYLFVFQDLYGANAIASNGFQQIEGIDRARPESLGHATTDSVAVR
ncbi:Uncharacterised protein [Bordetella pertussis]|nr:Uncharacterised protein [Bordetella pertussis]